MKSIRFYDVGQIDETVEEANNLIDNAKKDLNDFKIQAQTALGNLTSDKVNVSDFETYQGQVTTALGGKSDKGHKHPISDVTSLQTTLDGKAPKNHQHNASDVLYTIKDDLLWILINTTIDKNLKGETLTGIYSLVNTKFNLSTAQSTSHTNNKYYIVYANTTTDVTSALSTGINVSADIEDKYIKEMLDTKRNTSDVISASEIDVISKWGGHLHQNAQDVFETFWEAIGGGTGGSDNIMNLTFRKGCLITTEQSNLTYARVITDPTDEEFDQSKIFWYIYVTYDEFLRTTEKLSYLSLDDNDLTSYTVPHIGEMIQLVSDERIRVDGKVYYYMWNTRFSGMNLIPLDPIEHIWDNNSKIFTAPYNGSSGDYFIYFNDIIDSYLPIIRNYATKLELSVLENKVSKVTTIRLNNYATLYVNEATHNCELHYERSFASATANLEYTWHSGEIDEKYRPPYKVFGFFIEPYGFLYVNTNGTISGKFPDGFSTRTATNGRVRWSY